MSKDFKKPNIEIAPELQFISKETIEAVDNKEKYEEATVGPELISTSESTGKAPEGYKINPMYIEVKSKRVQLVFQPTFYEKVKDAAKKAGLSFNEYCHRALEEAMRKDL